MNPALGVIIMMNNYLHDVATALLLASGVAMWIVVKKFGKSSDSLVTDYFLKIYYSLTRLAKFSLFWIMLGGVPRILAYKDFEWADAVGKNQVPALITKHIIIFIVVTAGVFVWIKLKKTVRELERHAQTGHGHQP